VCYNAHSTDPISHGTSLQKESSGAHYLLKNYVTCTKFSTSPQQFLASISKVEEPNFYHEGMKNEKWRQAMAEEI